MNLVAIIPLLFPGPESDLVVLENFDLYRDDAEIARAWYKPPHGATLTQTRAKGVDGTLGLRVKFQTQGTAGMNYAAICRVHNWNVQRTHNAIRFWLLPDGSGHHVGIEINVANPKFDPDHDLWGYTYRPKLGDRSPRWVTVPFKDLVRPKWLEGKGKVPVFQLHDIVEIAYYFGSEQEKFGPGSYVIDDISILNLKEGQ